MPWAGIASSFHGPNTSHPGCPRPSWLREKRGANLWSWMVAASEWQDGLSVSIEWQDGLNGSLNWTSIFSRKVSLNMTADHPAQENCTLDGPPFFIGNQFKSANVFQHITHAMK